MGNTFGAVETGVPANGALAEANEYGKIVRYDALMGKDTTPVNP